MPVEETVPPQILYMGWVVQTNIGGRGGKVLLEKQVISIESVSQYLKDLQSSSVKLNNKKVGNAEGRNLMSPNVRGEAKRHKFILRCSGLLEFMG